MPFPRAISLYLYQTQLTCPHSVSSISRVVDASSKHTCDPIQGLCCSTLSEHALSLSISIDLGVRVERDIDPEMCEPTLKY